jgi:glycerol-3-phosphate acyltransferase PlsY
VLAGWLAGAIPFANIAARRTRGVDLRTVGSGTVSGTALHQVAGFGPLAVAGVLEVGKGAVGPLLAGRDRSGVAALAGGAAVAGHNWSPFLRGAGGRGISPATGALLVTAPAAAATLLAGLVVGRLARATGLGSFVADLMLVPVGRRVHGRPGAAATAAVLVPLVAKRLAGNAPPSGGRWLPVLARRLLFDRDERGDT